VKTQGKQLILMAVGASQMGFLVAGGLILGMWADRRLETVPWLGFLGLIGGFAAGVHFLIRLVRISRE